MSMYIGVRSHAFRFFAVVLAVFLTVGFAGAASADNDDTITICHANEGRPGYVLETINLAALPTHKTHQDREDIIPAPAEGCPEDEANDGDNPGGNNPGSDNGGDHPDEDGEDSNEDGDDKGGKDDEGDDESEDGDDESEDGDDESEEGDDDSEDDESDEDGDKGDVSVKFEVCHVNGKGKVVLKTVSKRAYDRHSAHGDKAPVDGVCVTTDEQGPTDPVTPGPVNPGPVNPGPANPGPVNPDPTKPGEPNGPKNPEGPKGEDGKGENPGSGSGGGSTEGPGKPGADKPNKPGKPGAGSPDKPIVDGVEGDRPAKGNKGDRPGNGPEPVKVSELVVVPAAENTSRVNRPGARVNRPAAKILPATGAGDNLGLLGATGLGMLLFGGLLVTGQRRPLRARR